jgi:hypothetical protein
LTVVKMVAVAKMVAAATMVSGDLSFRFSSIDGVVSSRSTISGRLAAAMAQML